MTRDRELDELRAEVLALQTMIGFLCGAMAEVLPDFPARLDRLAHETVERLECDGSEPRVVEMCHQLSDGITAFREAAKETARMLAN